MKTEDVKLRECPFCGGKVEMKAQGEDFEHEICCYHCDITLMASAVDNLVEHWNTRSQDHLLEMAAEALRDAEMWVQQMREAVNTPNAEHFFLDARLQNLEAWCDSERKQTLLTLQQHGYGKE